MNYFWESENGNYFENMQHFNFTYIFIWVRKLDSDSFTGTKNWSGRNEIIETSGRPLWPKTNDSIRRELNITCVLDKIDEYRLNWLLHLQSCHKTESLWNHTTTDNKEGEQLEDRRNVGESSCNSGDGTDQRVQSLMFMMMMMVHSWPLLLFIIETVFSARYKLWLKNRI